MQTTDLLILSAYNRWVYQRILLTCEHFSLAQFLATIPVSYESLRGTLVHIQGTQWL